MSTVLTDGVLIRLEKLQATSFSYRTFWLKRVVDNFSVGYIDYWQDTNLWEASTVLNVRVGHFVRRKNAIESCYRSSSAPTISPFKYLREWKSQYSVVLAMNSLFIGTVYKESSRWQNSFEDAYFTTREKAAHDLFNRKTTE